MGFCEVVFCTIKKKLLKTSQVRSRPESDAAVLASGRKQPLPGVIPRRSSTINEIGGQFELQKLLPNTTNQNGLEAKPLNRTASETVVLLSVA